jgi:hypothetical protein
MSEQPERLLRRAYEAFNARDINPWLSIAVEQMAKRIATRQVLLRLSTALDRVASEFEIYAEKTPSR